ncbi:MAG: MFS transporter [Lachnospiraceae bacterium]|nr:MFS transporter [Lachnospiraceae bacterium]
MNKNFYCVWISRLVSILGSSLTTFGVSVWVYGETGKATPMAVTMLCSILPSVIFAPLSGMVCDYFNRKKVILIADSTAAITSLLLLLYLMTERFDFGMICAFTFINATANMLDNNAYQASLSTLVKENSIKKAGGMNQIIDSISSMIAPVCAGILYYPVGLKGLLIIDLCTYIAAMFIFIRVPASAFSESDKRKKEHENIFENISAGFRFIFSQRGLTLLMLFYAMFNFPLNVSDSLTEPLVLSLGSSFDMGLVKMAGGIGIFLGSFFITKKGMKCSYSRSIFISAMATGAALCVIGIRNNIYTIILGEFVFLFIIPIVNTMAGTLWILKTPKELQGRVYAARGMVVKGTIPLSYLLVGPMADRWIPMFLQKHPDACKAVQTVLNEGNLNYRLVYVMAGMTAIVLALLFFSQKDLRHLDQN